jgi:hypothetical protein
MNEITRDDTEYGVRYVRADEAQAMFEKLNSALHEWHNKTDWVQETAQPLELGMHRADVLKQRIERLNKAAQQAPDYAWPTIEDYEKEVGFEVNIAFRSAWAMARTTNDLFKQMGETK